MRYTAIDLSSYPAPDAIEALDYEATLAQRKARFLTRFEERGATEAELAEMRDILSYEFEPIVGLLEADAFSDLTMIARINDKVRAVMLASAMDADLDHIGATYFRAPRRVITPADPATGAAAIMEDNETYRQRLALSPESWSAAGPEGAYLYFGISASGDVLDLAGYSEDEGVCLAPRLRVPVLAQGEIAATGALLNTVSTALNRKEIRPMGDLVTVEPAQIIPYTVDITLQVRPGASAEVLRAAALARVNAYTSGKVRWAGDGVNGPVWLIGRRIRTSSLAAAARVDGVEEVIVNGPLTDINAAHAGYTPAALAGVGTNDFQPLAADVIAHLFRAPVCTAVNISIETISAGWSS